MSNQKQIHQSVNVFGPIVSGISLDLCRVCNCPLDTNRDKQWVRRRDRRCQDCVRGYQRILMAKLRDPLNEDPVKRKERLRKQRILNRRFRRTRGQSELGTTSSKKNASLADYIRGQARALGLQTYLQLCHSSQLEEIRQFSTPDVKQVHFDDERIAGIFSH